MGELYLLELVGEKLHLYLFQLWWLLEYLGSQAHQSTSVSLVTRIFLSPSQKDS